MNVSKFPSHIPAVKKSVDSLYTDLLALFHKTGFLILTEYQNTLLINGQPFKSQKAGERVIDNMVALMVDNFVGEITLEKTLGREELMPFLQILMSKNREIDFAKELEKSGVKNIKISKATYGRIKEDDEFKDKMLEGILTNYLAGNIEQVSEAEMQTLKMLQGNPKKVAEVIASILKMGKGEAEKMDIDQLAERFSKSILDIGKLFPTDTGEKWGKYKKSMDQIIKNLRGPLKALLSESGLDLDAGFIEKEIRKKIDSSSEGLKTKAAKLVDELMEKIDGAYPPIVEALEKEGREALIPLIYLLHKHPLHEDSYNAYLLIRIAAGLLEKLGGDAFQRLQAELLDDRWYVVRNTIEALGHIKDGVSPATIEPFLKDEMQCIREAASLALKRIKGATPQSPPPHIERF